jgi:CheY-like chemotaxis protein
MKSTVCVLLVEDNPLDVRIFHKAFPTEEGKCRIVTKNNGAEAFEYLRELLHTDKTALPQLIISDINMPAMSGYELLEKLKADEELKNIPFIVYSGSSNERDVQLAYDLHAASYIIKPFDVSQIKQNMQILYDFWFGTATLL